MKRQLVLAANLVGLVGASHVAQGARGYARPQMLSQTAELAGDSPPVTKRRIVDARAAEAYAQGHIPGAVHFDASKLRTKNDETAFLPQPAEVAAMASALGIGSDTRVVIYDDGGPSPLAARLWYVLDHHGHPNLALLDGGIAKWKREGRPLSTETPRAVTAASFKATANPASLCTADQVKQKIGKPNTVIIDTRSPEEFLGAKARARRSGHIPGAVNVDWRNNLTAEGTFKPADELRSMYEKAGVTAGKEVVTYCQSGGRASHTLFVLKLLGFDKGRNYYGSWEQWGNRDDTPVETK
jgi:thiosulfate/3-mercaptopyruvate sulfurtransferase